jgi:pseudouridine synthase
VADERLAKLLSHIGIASRRRCDEIISSGRVTVNDIIVLDPGHRVSPAKDSISIDGRALDQALKEEKKPIYIALYKPDRYLSDLLSSSDRQVARSLIPMHTYLFPVGRLDYHSEGLMLFTNDGELANRVMHPRYGMEKEYVVKFKGAISDVALRAMIEGVIIEGVRYKVARVRFVRHSLVNSWYNVVLTEGRNRMIRKLGEKIGHPVLKLKRIRIGPIKLGDLMPGQFRFLNAREVKGLLDSAGR